MAGQPSTLTREQMKEQRLEGGRLLRARRLTQTAIARELGVSRSKVNEWNRQLAN